MNENEIEPGCGPFYQNMSFTSALDFLRYSPFEDKGIQREGWNGKGLQVKLQTPDEGSKMTLPYLYIEYPDGARCPWHASQTDILADDWALLSEGKGLE